jgi:hypothetical protein
MSREFGDTLSKEDVKTMADVRRDIWTSGFKGMIYGSFGGYLLHTFMRLGLNTLSDASRGKLLLPGSEKPIRFTRNTAFFSVMAGGALGSFVLATTTGKNKVHNMHGIFEIGKNEYKTPYQQAYENARKAGENEEGKDYSPQELRRQRLLSRRRTMSTRLTQGHGLSDSHGGTWQFEEDLSEDERRRVERRMSMAKRLENPNIHGLSDSHGGKWRD